MMGSGKTGHQTIFLGHRMVNFGPPGGDTTKPDMIVKVPCEQIVCVGTRAVYLALKTGYKRREIAIAPDGDVTITPLGRARAGMPLRRRQSATGRGFESRIGRAHLQLPATFTRRESRPMLKRLTRYGRTLAHLLRVRRQEDALVRALEDLQLKLYENPPKKLHTEAERRQVMAEIDRIARGMNRFGEALTRVQFAARQWLRDATPPDERPPEDVPEQPNLPQRQSPFSADVTPEQAEAKRRQLREAAQRRAAEAASGWGEKCSILATSPQIQPSAVLTRNSTSRSRTDSTVAWIGRIMVDYHGMDDLELPQPADLHEIRLEEHFAAWVGQGEGRTYKALAEQLDMPVTAVIRHAKKFHWVARLAAIAQRGAEITMERMGEAVADVNQEHVSQLRELRKKAFESLLRVPIEKPQDAIRLFMDAAKLERAALGLDANGSERELADLLAERVKQLSGKVVAEPAEKREEDHEFFDRVGFKPHKGQQQIHAALERAVLAVVACGARFGKTLAAAHEMAFEAIRPRERSEKNPEGEFMGWCVAPTHQLADLVFDMTAGILRKFLKGRVSVNKTDGVIELTNLGGSRSRIMRRSTDQASGKAKLVGYAVDFMVVDEASGVLDDDVWENQLRTRLIDRAGRCLLISTPRGTRGFFAALHRRAQTDDQIIAIKLPSWLNPYIDKKILMRERQQMPARAFAQEYGAEFIAASGRVFLPEFIDACATGTFEEPTEDGDYVAALDLAMNQDHSCLMVARPPRGTETRPKIVHLDRWFKLPVEAQIARVKATLQAYGDAPCKADETGLGAPIVEQMRNAGIYVQGVKWTATNKMGWVNNACALVERAGIEIPTQELAPIFHEELSIYGWQETPSGKLTANAPEGAHDDTVATFLLLAQWFPAAGTRGQGQAWHGGIAEKEAAEERRRRKSAPTGDGPEMVISGMAHEDYDYGEADGVWTSDTRPGDIWQHPFLRGARESGQLQQRADELDARMNELQGVLDAYGPLAEDLGPEVREAYERIQEDFGKVRGYVDEGRQLLGEATDLHREAMAQATDPDTGETDWLQYALLMLGGAGGIYETHRRGRKRTDESVAAERQKTERERDRLHERADNADAQVADLVAQLQALKHKMEVEVVMSLLEDVDYIVTNYGWLLALLGIEERLGNVADDVKETQSMVRKALFGTNGTPGHAVRIDRLEQWKAGASKLIWTLDDALVFRRPQTSWRNYRHDPVGFARSFLHVKLDEEHADHLSDLGKEPQRMGITSPTFDFWTFSATVALWKAFCWRASSTLVIVPRQAVGAAWVLHAESLLTKAVIGIRQEVLIAKNKSAICLKDTGDDAWAIAHAEPRALDRPECRKLVRALKKQLRDAPQEVQMLRRENGKLRKKAVIADGAREVITDIVGACIADWDWDFDIPEPVETDVPKMDDETIALAHFTDLQCGKITRTYNSEIAHARSMEYAEKVAKAVFRRNAQRGVKKLHVYWGGDMVEGELIFPHQAHEIDQSVFDQACIKVPTIMTEMIAFWLQHFEEIEVFAIAGNHGRPASKNAGSHPRTNWDRVTYECAKLMIEGMLARSNVDPSRVKINISDDFYIVDECLGHKNLLIHGDQIRGGFAGFPWYGMGKKMWGWIDSIEEDWNHLYFGHFHQMVAGDLNGRRFYCGGTPESDNTFARAELAASGRPQQRLQLITSEQVVCDLPIYLNYGYRDGGRKKRR
ncbi:Terminase [Durusdinium trenchii]|uniref:Large subunit (DNA-packaging protein) (Gene product 85) (Gp85) n=1 Tax=Durusdinium trenchii TaxID=1381693 RepID=A0ABP0PDR3_9DINO